MLPDFLSNEAPPSSWDVTNPQGLSSSLTLKILSSKKSITVNVSGTYFCIAPTIFERVENLAWYEDKGVPSLVANPRVFEMLLQYFLFESLPDVFMLTDEESRELQDLSIPVRGIDSLIEHVVTGRTANNKKRMGKTSFLRLPSLSSSRSRKKQKQSHNTKKEGERETLPVQETIYPFAASAANATVDVDYYAPPPLKPAYSQDSEDGHTVLTTAFTVSSFGSLPDNLTNERVCEEDDDSADDEAEADKENKPNKKKRKRNSIFKGVLGSSKKTTTGRKWTHEQWCASDYIL